MGEQRYHWRPIMRRRSVRLLKLPLGNKPNNAPLLKLPHNDTRNSAQQRKRRHDSRLPLPDKLNNASPPKPPHDSKRNSMQRRKRQHDSRPPLPNKPSNAPLPKPPHGNRPLSRHSSTPPPERPRDSSMRNLAGIQGSHPARSDGLKKVQEQRHLFKHSRLSQWLASPRRSPGSQIAAADDRDARRAEKCNLAPTLCP